MRAVRVARDPAIARGLRRLLLTAISLSAAALLLGAVFLGWKLHDWISGAKTTQISVTVKRPINVIKQAQQTAGLMPNVLGLDVDTARQVLIDAAVDPKRITTTKQPYAGAVNTVVAQTPSSGATVGAGPIALSLSAPAKMPLLVGMAANAARDTLAQLGASVLVKTRYSPGARENTVLETEPTGGTPLVDRSTLTIAEPPSSVFLNQLRSINSNCGTQTLNVAGIQHKDAFVCEPGQDSPTELEYLLNRHVASFNAVLGLGDRGGTDTPVTLRIFVDGRLARVVTLAFGGSTTVAVRVVGALRIRLEAAVSKVGPSGQNVAAVFADARFLGGRSAIDSLVAESSQ